MYNAEDKYTYYTTLISHNFLGLELSEEEEAEAEGEGDATGGFAGPLPRFVVSGKIGALVE